MRYRINRQTGIVAASIEFTGTLTGIFIIAVSLSMLASFVSDFQDGFAVAAPQNISGWLLLAVSCLGAACFEEFIFRKYIPEKLSCAGAGEAAAIACSAALFAFFHRWEGIWGVYNAFFSAVFLSWCYKRHGLLMILVLAHAVYNFLVYVVSVI